MADILYIFLGAGVALIYHLYRDWAEERRIRTIIAGIKSETAYEFKSATKAERRRADKQGRPNPIQERFQ